jgi:hypothetical protein
VKYGFDDGFMKKPKFLPCFGQQKILSKNTVVIDLLYDGLICNNFKIIESKIILSGLDSLM